MKKIIKLLDNYFFEIVLSVLAFMALWNGYNNVGIWSDCGYKIFEGLCNNIRVDASRFSPSFLLSLCSQIFNSLQVYDVKLFIKISSYWMYFITFIPLVFIYFLLPKKQKNFFSFPLICYILSFIFAQYFITSEIFLSSAFYWIILLAVLFNDFKTISVSNQIILFFFCVLLTSSYQSVIMYSLFLMLLIFYRTFNIFCSLSKTKQIFILLIYFSLFISLIFNFISIFYPQFFEYCSVNIHEKFISSIMQEISFNIGANSSYKDYISGIVFLIKEPYLIYVFFIILIMFVKNKYINIFSFISLIVLTWKYILFNTTIFTNSHDYRIFVFLFTLIFSICIIFAKKMKISSFIRYKFVIIILLSVYVINTVYFGNNLNKVFNVAYENLMQYEKNIVSEKDFFINFNEEQYGIFWDKTVFPIHLFILQLLLSDNNKEISKLVLGDIDCVSNDIDKQIAVEKINSIINNLRLKEIGIKYNYKLLKEIDDLNNDFISNYRRKIQ